MPFLLTEVLKAKRYVCMEVHCKFVHNVSCPKNRKYKIFHCGAEYMYLKEKTVDEKKGGFKLLTKREYHYGWKVFGNQEILHSVCHI